MFACGRNRDGTLGLGHTKITVVPQPVEKLHNTTVDNVVAGVAMSVFIDKQGHAYWSGQGTGGLEEVQMSSKKLFLTYLTAIYYGTNKVEFS